MVQAVLAPISESDPLNAMHSDLISESDDDDEMNSGDDEDGIPTQSADRR